MEIKTAFILLAVILLIASVGADMVYLDDSKPNLIHERDDATQSVIINNNFTNLTTDVIYNSLGQKIIEYVYGYLNIGSYLFGLNIYGDGITISGNSFIDLFVYGNLMVEILPDVVNIHGDLDVNNIIDETNAETFYINDLYSIGKLNKSCVSSTGGMVRGEIRNVCGSLNGETLNNYNASLVAYYDFDNYSNNYIYDNTNNNLDLINYSVSKVVSDGKFNNGFNLTRQNGYAEGSDNTNVDNADIRTLSAWIKIAGFQTAEYVVPVSMGSASTNAMYEMLIGADGSLYFHKWGTTYDSGVNLGTNKWYFITMAYNGTYVKQYIDGSLVASSNVGTLGTTNAPLTIGKTKYNVYNIRYFNGTIDEVMLWDKELNINEIIQLNNSNPHNLNWVNQTSLLYSNDTLYFHNGGGVIEL